MKRVIIAPDSFKGTMTALEVSEIIEQTVRRYRPDLLVSKIPMSDGGEGMAESYISQIGGEMKSAFVTGPAGKKVECRYGILPDKTAVMEMAACAGLSLMNGELRPLHATTYGVGEMVNIISSQGCRKLLMGLGGSATNDCGIGMAAALGYRFFDADGSMLEPFAYNLSKVECIVKPKRLPYITVTAACDVDSPLCGERGSCAVFGPQKGLNKEQIPAHDAAMRHFAEVIKRDLGVDAALLPGSGAAGGLGMGVRAFLNAELAQGIELLLDSVGIDELLKNTVLVITGEGRIDGQSAAGKVPVGVGQRAKRAGVPCIALCGCIGENADEVLKYGIDAYYASSNTERSFEDIKANCFADMAHLADMVLPRYLACQN